MTVQEHIKNDLKIAMREKNVAMRDLLRVVIGEFNREGKEVSDKRATAIIKKMYDNAVEFNNESEVELLGLYLPEQMDELELKRVCMNYIMNMDSPKDIGKIMGYLKVNFDGQYDGKAAASLVRELLS